MRNAIHLRMDGRQLAAYSHLNGTIKDVVMKKSREVVTEGILVKGGEYEMMPHTRKRIFEI